jgi:hypothetical protein
VKILVLKFKSHKNFKIEDAPSLSEGSPSKHNKQLARERTRLEKGKALAPIKHWTNLYDNSSYVNTL